MNRIFENEALIVVDKPVNWLTTPAREADDPRPCLGRRLQDELGFRIFPVHRLDFEVSGLVLFAKTAAAHRLAQAWFEGGRVTQNLPCAQRRRPRVAGRVDRVAFAVGQGQAPGVPRGARQGRVDPRPGPAGGRSVALDAGAAHRSVAPIAFRAGRSRVADLGRRALRRGTARARVGHCVARGQLGFRRGGGADGITRGGRGSRSGGLRAKGQPTALCRTRCSLRGPVAARAFCTRRCACGAPRSRSAISGWAWPQRTRGRRRPRRR